MFSNTLQNVFATLGIISIVLCQWLGVYLLAKSYRDNAWWAMFTGTFVATGGSIGHLFFWLNFLNGWFPFEQSITWLNTTGMLHSFGSLIFFAGFLIHSAAGSNQSRRIKELEGIIASQAR